MEHTRSWFDSNQKIYTKDKCANCNSIANLTLHHIVPLAKGGTNNISNIVCLCDKCHNLIHDTNRFDKQWKALQADGIERARANGVHLGRQKIHKPINWDEVIKEHKSGKITSIKAMELTGVKRTTFYKYYDEWSKDLE